ncbi:MAG: aminoacetone oxidase family FAD-binding enzyme [Candidatus Paceibacterota bacterium]
MKKEKDLETPYDVVVIGGGSAGMMAAGRAAERGLRVLLLEKNESLGKKLLITGGGRCNVTNAEFDVRTLLSNFKESEQFLFSAFAQHGVKDTLHFFNSRGMETKMENNKRVFPVSDSARSVWEVLVHYMEQGGVVVKTNQEVARISAALNRVTGIVLQGGRVLTASSYILATGGKSRPETGSTGDGFMWLTSLGHSVVEPDASLVPVALSEEWISRLAGISLSPVKLGVYQNNEKELVQTGKLLFTHIGISGPMVLNMSKSIGELLEYGSVTIKLDLFPTHDEASLDLLLVQLLQRESNKQLKNALSSILPKALISVIVAEFKIPGDELSHSVTKETRRKLVRLLKGLPLTVKNLLGTDKAIVTSGGVELKEVHFKTMQSRLYHNLYLVGDVLHIDRPSGGYSLQLCWTTGFVAGNSVPLITPA